MKTRILSLVKIASATALVALGAATASAQTLRLGHITPPSHVWHQVSEKIASELETASGGKMKVAVSPLQRLGNEAQMINMIQSGAIQFGVFTAAGLSNREQAFLGWSLPYVFRDIDHAAQAAVTPAAREMLARLEAHGMVGLGYVFAGMRHVLSVEPVRTPRDLANKKVRAFPNPVYNDWWSALGAAPTALPLSEIAPALTTRLLDAVDIDLDALVGLQFHQQAPNLTLTNHMAFPAAIVVSKRWWDARSDAEREMIRKVVADAEAWGFALAAQTDLSNLDKAKADGAKVVDADLAAFQQAAAAIRDKYIALDPLIADFHAQATEL